MDTLKDWRGHTITIGTPVAYMSTSIPMLKEGIVTEIGESERFPGTNYARVEPYVVVKHVGASIKGYENMTNRPIRLEHMERVVVLPRASHE